MVISLEEAKLYLRVDGDEEDTLITDFIKASEDICEGVLRFPLSDFEDLPETVKQAILFGTAQFFELRESLDTKLLIETIKRMLFAYRQEGW